jgi:hypothetical protein
MEVPDPLDIRVNTKNPVFTHSPKGILNHQDCQDAESFASSTNLTPLYLHMALIGLLFRLLESLKALQFATSWYLFFVHSSLTANRMILQQIISESYHICFPEEEI